MTFKEYLLENRFHNFFSRLKQEKEVAAVYYGKFGWFHVYRIIEGEPSFKYFRTSPGKIIEAYPEKEFLKIKDACEKISNNAQKNGLRKQDATIIIRFETQTGAYATFDYRMIFINVKEITGGVDRLFTLLTHEWAHMLLFNLSKDSKEKIREIVDYHRSKIESMIGKKLPNHGDEYQKLSKENDSVINEMEKYAREYVLPGGYSLCNEDEMWAQSVEAIISNKKINNVLRKIILNSI